jgi:hypothetical protein
MPTLFGLESAVSAVTWNEIEVIKAAQATTYHGFYRLARRKMTLSKREEPA